VLVVQITKDQSQIVWVIPYLELLELHFNIAFNVLLDISQQSLSQIQVPHGPHNMLSQSVQAQPPEML